MGSVWTIMNMKGGVGKTTIAMHLAGAIGLYNLGKSRRALAIDYDPQFNLSQSYIAAKKYFELEKDRKTTLSILIDDEVNVNPYDLKVPGNHNPPKLESITTQIYSNGANNGGLDLVPSTLDLMYVALGQSEKKTKPLEERFEKFIDQCRAKYDVTIIDCHPAGSLFTKTSLRNSDHLVIPVDSSSSYAIRGIGLMMRFIDTKKAGTKGPVPHILFNRTPRAKGKVHSAETQIRTSPEFSAFCLRNTMKQFGAFSKPEGGKGFVWHSQAPYSTEALGNVLNVTRELLSRTGA